MRARRIRLADVRAVEYLFADVELEREAPPNPNRAVDSEC